jgi:hypothetical protein
MIQEDHGMTPEELWAWYEAGLSSHGTELGDWEKEAIIRYGRLLTQKQNERIRSTAP